MHVVKQKQDSDNCNNETSIGDLEMRSIKAVEDAKKWPKQVVCRAVDKQEKDHVQP